MDGIIMADQDPVRLSACQPVSCMAGGHGLLFHFGGPMHPDGSLIVCICAWYIIARSAPATNC
jgi:hypothetical protein